MDANVFKEKMYELAFGEDAIENGYTDEEVVEQLTKWVQEMPKFVLEKSTQMDNLDESSDEYKYLERVVKEAEEFLERQ